MRIIPAIDIIDGKCVRLSQGDYSRKKIYNESPLEVAKEFQDSGIQYLHLVDLDGAKAKKIVNQDVLELICMKTDLIVDFGGGLKTNEDLKIAFDSGANQVTAGSIAVSNSGLVENWIEHFGPDKIILGADVKDEQIMINGWQTNAEIEITSFIERFVKTGLQSVISTDISTDGMLSGPSIPLYKKLISEFPNLKIIASGGVGSLTDLDQLKLVGVEGVIIGKAIYENKVCLKELQNYVD